MTFDVPDYELPFAQILNIALALNSPELCDVSVTLNGKRITNYDESYSPFREFVLVPGVRTEIGIPRGMLNAGVNTMKISRIDGGRFPAMIDSITMGRHGRVVRVRTSGYSIVIR